MSVYFPVQPINYNRVKRMNVDYAAVGQRIKDVRKARRLTQEQLAEALSVSVGYVSQVERGVTKVSLDTLSAIAARLDCDLAQLVSGMAVGHESYLHRELGQAVERMDGRQKRLLLDMARLILKY